MDDVYRLRAEVRELADELTRLRTWDSGRNNDGRYALVKPDGITAASSDTLGKGRIRLYNRDPDSLDGRVLVDSGVDDDCYNAGGAVAGSRYILVQWVDNAWSVIVDACDS